MLENIRVRVEASFFSTDSSLWTSWNEIGHNRWYIRFPFDFPSSLISLRIVIMYDFYTRSFYDLFQRWTISNRNGILWGEKVNVCRHDDRTSRISRADRSFIKQIEIPISYHDGSTLPTCLHKIRSKVEAKRGETKHSTIDSLISRFELIKTNTRQNTLSAPVLPPAVEKYL